MSVERHSGAADAAGTVHATEHGAGWQALPWLVVRQAGFPFGWLTELASAPAGEAARRLLSACRDAARARRAALDLLRGATSGSAPEAARAVRRAHTLVTNAGPVPEATIASVSDATAGALRAWNGALSRVLRAREQLASIHEAEHRATAAHVVSRFRRDACLMEVLLLSNEASFDVLLDQLQRAGDGCARRLVDTLVLYLQRVCAKNETHSHFGPFTLGRVARAGGRSLRWTGVGELQRVAFCAHWAAALLAARIGADPDVRPWLVPRLSPGAFPLEGTAEVWGLHFAGLPGPDSRPGIPVRVVPLDETRTAVLRACDGRRLADVDACPEALCALEREGVLLTGLEPPVGRAEPLGELAGLLPPDTRWRQVLEELRQALAAFATAPLGARRRRFAAIRERFEELTGSRGVRGLGRVYADRSVLYEECRRLDGVEVGGDLLRAVESELAPVYDLFLVEPRRRLALERALLSEWFAARWGPGRRVGVRDYVLGAIADADRLEAGHRAVDRELAATREQIERSLVPDRRADERLLVLDPERVARLLAGHDTATPAVCNPDVMVVAASLEALNRGEFRLVVGECHVMGQEITSHTSFSHFMEDACPEAVAALADAYRRLVAPDEVAVDVLRGHADKTYVQLELRCPDLEIEGRSPKPRESVLALRDLEVHHSPGGLRLYAPRLVRYVRPMTAPIGNNQLPRNPFRIFGFPRHTGGPLVGRRGLRHLPRLVMGSTIVQRETWRVASADLAAPLALGRVRLDEGPAGAVVRTARLREELDLPRFVFARFPGEHKPVFIDLEAPLLARQLVRLGARAAGAVELTEMLPSPDALWLTGPEGRHTAELRFALFHP